MISRIHIKHKRNQQGLASFIVVFTLVILISLVSVGFSKLMDRAINNASNNQLRYAAEYAAQSGLNDAVALIKTGAALPANSDTNCNSLAGAGGLLADKSNITTDGNTKYTCVLINDDPADIAYQKLPAFNSQVVKLTTGPNSVNNLLFSWQASDVVNRNSFVSSTGWLDEASWGRRAPVLKVTLYSVASDTVTSNKSFFLYSNGNAASPIGSISYGSASGSILRANCGTSATKGTSGFNDAAGNVPKYDCNAIISSISGPVDPGYLVARITPLYGPADVGLEANNASNTAIKFQNVQSVVDVTAKSATAVKRIQARVSTGDAQNVKAGEDNIPGEYSIRSAETLCKRLLVPNTASLNSFVIVDANSASRSPNCQSDFMNVTIPPPTVTLRANPTSVLQGDTTNLTWTVGGYADDCNGSWGSPSKNVSGGTESSGAISSLGKVKFTITCSNPGGSKTAEAEVDILAKPSVKLTASQPAITAGESTNLSWTSSNTTSCSAAFTGSTATSGSQPVSPSSTTTYTITCNGALGSTDSDSVTITVGPPSGGGGVTTCQDPTATNFGGPLPCTYGGGGGATCGDTNATNYGGPVPCVYPPLVIDWFGTAGIWDQGPTECNSASGIPNTWRCRNNPNRELIPSVGCVNGIHRWTTCWSSIAGHGGVGAIRCYPNSPENGNWTTWTMTGPGNWSNSTGPLGWVNSGVLFDAILRVQCWDSIGQYATAQGGGGSTPPATGGGTTPIPPAPPPPPTITYVPHCHPWSSTLVKWYNHRMVNGVWDGTETLAGTDDAPCP